MRSFVFVIMLIPSSMNRSVCDLGLRESWHSGFIDVLHLHGAAGFFLELGLYDLLRLKTTPAAVLRANQLENYNNCDQKFLHQTSYLQSSYTSA